MFKDKKLLSVIGLSFISFFSTIWIRKADLMESRNFITAREIIFNNEWLVTTLNGQYRFEKPPLPTWFTAIIMKLFNNFSDEWILRIPVALVSIILIFFIYRFVQELTDNKNLPFLVSFVAATTFMLIKVGSENAWDAYPYIFMFGSITYLLKSLKSKKNLELIIAALLLAASLLSKGPIALYGMFLPFIASYIFIYKFKDISNNKIRISLYFLIGFLIASIWPIAMILENKDLFFSVMNKEKNTWSNKHVKSFYFYLNYFLFMGTWSFFSVFAFFKKWKFKNNSEKQLFSLGIFWTILTFILLSFVKMKKERYGFPLYITSSISIGVVLNYYLENSWSFFKKSDKILFYIQSIFISIVCIGSIGIILWKQTSLFYLAIPFLIVLIYLFKDRLVDKNNFKKRVIYLSGILLIIINCNLTWIIEKDIRNNRNFNFSPLETLQKKQKNFHIYSDDFTIEDVWSVGQNIHPLNSTEIFPESFYILSKNENFDKENNFNIEYKETYSRFKDSNDLIYIYKIINE